MNARGSQASYDDGSARRVLVVGASGLVGARVLARLGRRALGTYHRAPAADAVALDVTDADAVERLIEGLGPEVVVLAAAYTDVDGCERDPERSLRVNVEGTRNVARATAALGARLLLFSTDYVFGGEGGPHGLDRPYAPLNVYGEHKRRAEECVRREVANHLIVRGCNMYGYQPGGKNFVMGVLNAAREGRVLRVPDDQWGNPTAADDLAEATALAVDSDLRGVAHFAGPDYVNRLQWARRAARALGFDDARIEGVPTSALSQTAPRPLSGGLDARPTEQALGFRFRSLDSGLARFRRSLEGERDGI